MPDSKLALIQRLLSEVLKFERFVEVMHRADNLIHTATPESCAFGRVAMDSAIQEDLASLFSLLYPTEVLDIKLEVVAKDAAGRHGAFSCALSTCGASSGT
jgi:hypothetical protein